MAVRWMTDVLSKLTTSERNFDRNFIMLGKVNSGKSTLSNLIYGPCDRTQFRVHTYKEAIGKTQKVSVKETHIASNIVYGDDFNGNNILKIQIMDQPGSNDANFTDKNFCENITSCLKLSRAELSDTFLLVADITDGYFSLEEMIAILNVAEVLSQSGYLFFQNAILVFTHADMIEDLEDRLEEILKTEEWASVGDLLKQIDNRKMFINAVNTSGGNRNSIIKTLFELSKPTLKVAITGNTGFSSDLLRERLNLEGENFVQKESEKFNVQYFFNERLSIFHKFEKHDIDEQVENELKKLFIISKGISVLVVLINLQGSFTQEFHDKIDNIPRIYSLQKSEKNENDPLWKYTFITFLSPIDNREFVERNVRENRFLMDIVKRVNNRYTWVTEEMEPIECYNRLIRTVLRVNHDSQGTSFINHDVVWRINQAIKTSYSTNKGHNAAINHTILGRESHLNEMQQSILANTGSGDVLIKANTFQWDKDEISHILGFSLVKCIKPEAADQFLESFPHPDRQIKKDKFEHFCLTFLK